MLREKVISAWSGIPMLLLTLVMLVVPIVAIVMIVRSTPQGDRPALVIASWIILWLANLIAMAGFFTVQPNQGVVLTLFGRYVGTAVEQGLRWANPFYSKKHVSLRVRNFETSKLKVNDQDGNPIEIAAVVVWKVVDTAEAIFQVDAVEGVNRPPVGEIVDDLAAAHISHLPWPIVAGADREVGVEQVIRRNLAMDIDIEERDLEAGGIDPVVPAV